MVEPYGTIVLTSIVTYTFGDGTKINGVTSISLEEKDDSPDVLGTFSLDSSQDLVFFFWDSDGDLKIITMPTFKTNFGCWPLIDSSRSSNSLAYASFKDCASNTYYSVVISKSSESVSAVHEFRMAQDTTNYQNLFTISSGGDNGYVVMVGKATFNGTPGVCWIGLNSNTGVAKMDAVLFNASFLSTYGSTYTPKFVRYRSSSNFYMLMDSDSPGLPIFMQAIYDS